MPQTFEEIMAALKDKEKPVLAAMVGELSHLSRDEAKTLDKACPEIPPEKRRRLMAMMVEMAEENPELDYDAILRGRLNDPDEIIRKKAVEGLWESEDAVLIGTFIQMMQNDSSPEVQAAAAQNLGRFTLAAEFGKIRPEYKERLAKALVGIYDDASRALEVRRRALESLAPLSLPQARPAISRAYASGIPRLKTSAIYAMGTSCDAVWLPILLKELDSPDAEIRFEASQALGEIGEAEAVPHLALHTRDTDAEVQMAAITALGKIGGTEAKQCLNKCLILENRAAKDAARAALEEIEADENPFSLLS